MIKVKNKLKTGPFHSFIHQQSLGNCFFFLEHTDDEKLTMTETSRESNKVKDLHCCWCGSWLAGRGGPPPLAVL